MKIRTRYAAIDLIDSHRDDNVSPWPAVVPPLTGPEAVRAARRLFRWATGETLTRPIAITHGNRRTWLYYGRYAVNPDKGWREFAHDLSHDFVARMNPGERPHSKFHARFESKMIREIVKRGWLDGRLRDKAQAAAKPDRPGPNDIRRAKLARIEQRIESWSRKQARAERAIAKLQRQRRYYERAIDKGDTK